MPQGHATRLLEYEAESLLERLNEVRPFALTLPMVAAAAPSVAAQAAIETFLAGGRRHLRAVIAQFLRWLRSSAGAVATPSQAQQRFAIVRIRFLNLITQFDVFADALAERSQAGYGEWLGGLDVVAADALKLPGDYFASPPVICHLDRGPGAAIRRARTRLPGGGLTPVAVIRIPRERMVGSSIASSLVHEVGHQGAELLGVVDAMREALKTIAAARPDESQAWLCFRGWISEIIADFWSVARVGITSTLGLIGVVSLPRAFVTRFSVDGPHPSPWIRVKISAAIGARLYPDLQWQRLASLWEALYPLEEVGPRDSTAFRALDRLVPMLADFLVTFQPASLRGLTLSQAFPTQDRTPERLRLLWQSQRRESDVLARLTPTVACATVGQAKFDGWITAAAEVRLLRRLLRFWALQSTIDAREVCANAQPSGLAVMV
jgi:hypothetical protein